MASQYARVEISRKEESAHGPGARCGFAGHAAPEPRNQGAPQSHRPVLERHCAPGLHDVGHQHAHRAVSARTPRFGCVPIRHRTGVFHHSLHRVARAWTHGKEGSDHAFRRRLGCARAQDRAHAHCVRPCCGDHARRAPVGDDAVHWIPPDEQERFMDDLARMRANLVETGLVGSERTADEPATRTRQATTHHQQKGDEAA